jgi:DNA invertase Pin-like site-specific DNA recombinase
MPGSVAARAATNGPATIAYVAALRAANSIRWRRGRSIGSVAHCKILSRSSVNCTPRGVYLYLHQQGIDTGTPAGKAMFQMLGVFAEFERAMIVERVKAGLSRARSQGKRLGRRPVSEAVVERIRERLATGTGILRVAKKLGVGTGTVHRVKREMAAEVA